MSADRVVANPIPVILDVDTGIDDALALLLAAQVAGARPAGRHRASPGTPAVDQVVRNTLKVLDAAGATDVPVARGADRPLLEPPRDARHVHGEDGMGDLGLAGLGALAGRRARDRADAHDVGVRSRARSRWCRSRR